MWLNHFWANLTHDSFFFYFASRHNYYYDVVVVAPPRPIALHVSRNFQYPPAPSAGFRLGREVGLNQNRRNKRFAQPVSE